MSHAVKLVDHEYLPERESPRGESRLHRRSPDLTPELQGTVWADEVVVAAQELEMFFGPVAGEFVRIRDTARRSRRSSRSHPHHCDDGARTDGRLNLYSGWAGATDLRWRIYTPPGTFASCCQAALGV